MLPFTRILTAAVSLLTLTTGCYFEGTVAYHPRISAPDAKAGGWSASANIGFYLDVGIPSRVIRGAGAGLAVFNGYGIKQSGAEESTAGRGIGARGDLVVGPQWLSRHLQHSFVFDYHWLGELSGPGTTPMSRGSVLFAGTGLDYRMPVEAWDGKMKNILWRLNAGVERFRGGDVSSTGVGARFMVVPAFVGRYVEGPYENINTSGSSTGDSCPGGYYRDDCDTDGNCRTVWTCP